MGSPYVSESVKPHAVCIPFPLQGHIKPMLALAKLLNQKGFHITFVNTEFIHQRLLETGGLGSLNGTPSFRFETIPDGLPPSDPEAKHSLFSLCESTSTACLSPLRDLLAKLNDNMPPVSCIVSDAFMTFTLEAAQELGIPEVLLWTSGVSALLHVVLTPEVIEKGYLPIKDKHMDTTIDDIPGMEGVRLRDLSSFIRTNNPLEDPTMRFLFQLVEGAQSRASAIVLNTVEDLEHDALSSLSSYFTPPVFAIGPLHSLESTQQDSVASPNLWREDIQCLEWLDSKEPNSVIYINFGSTAVMTPDHLVEFALGLAGSNISFLWIIRPDLVIGGASVNHLPLEFLEATKERGRLANWCPQEKVLSHPSIGGFITHSGWNSTLESICSGVPMICWPFFADQQINCWACCKKWGIGMEMDSDNVNRDLVKGLVSELMTGDKGKAMKKRAMEWKKKMVSANNLSRENMKKMIHGLLLPLPKV